MNAAEALEAVHRAAVDLLDDAPVPVYRWLPGDANDTPCFVAALPDLAPDNETAAVGAFTVEVFALGRTVRDPDAQEELLALGGLLARRFWSPPRTADGIVVRLDSLEHGTAEIAGVTVPVYTAALSARVMFCP